MQRTLHDSVLPQWHQLGFQPHKTMWKNLVKLFPWYPTNLYISVSKTEIIFTKQRPDINTYMYIQQIVTNSICLETYRCIFYLFKSISFGFRIVMKIFIHSQTMLLTTAPPLSRSHNFIWWLLIRKKASTFCGNSVYDILASSLDISMTVNRESNITFPLENVDNI